MTIGHVGADGDALVPLPVRGPGGAEQEVEAVLDTGFNGYLALPPPVIEALRLERLGQETSCWPVASGAIRASTKPLSSFWESCGPSR
jgi:predicted aspartyl protease